MSWLGSSHTQTHLIERSNGCSSWISLKMKTDTSMYVCSITSPIVSYICLTYRSAHIYFSWHASYMHYWLFALVIQFDVFDYMHCSIVLTSCRYTLSLSMGFLKLVSYLSFLFIYASRNRGLRMSNDGVDYYYRSLEDPLFI